MGEGGGGKLGGAEWYCGECWAAYEQEGQEQPEPQAAEAEAAETEGAVDSVDARSPEGQAAEAAEAAATENGVELMEAEVDREADLTDEQMAQRYRQRGKTQEVDLDGGGGLPQRQPGERRGTDAREERAREERSRSADGRRGRDKEDKGGSAGDEAEWSVKGKGSGGRGKGGAGPDGRGVGGKGRGRGGHGKGGGGSEAHRKSPLAAIAKKQGSTSKGKQRKEQ